MLKDPMHVNVLMLVWILAQQSEVEAQSEAEAD